MNSRNKITGKKNRGGDDGEPDPGKGLAMLSSALGREDEVQLSDRPLPSASAFLTVLSLPESAAFPFIYNPKQLVFVVFVFRERGEDYIDNSYKIYDL